METRLGDHLRGMEEIQFLQEEAGLQWEMYPLRQVVRGSREVYKEEG
jgi:hypothetical protein